MGLATNISTVVRMTTWSWYGWLAHETLKLYLRKSLRDELKLRNRPYLRFRGIDVINCALLGLGQASSSLIGICEREGAVE